MEVVGYLFSRLVTKQWDLHCGLPTVLWDDVPTAFVIGVPTNFAGAWYNPQEESEEEVEEGKMADDTA